MTDASPVLPAYGGASISNVIPALTPGAARPSWLPLCAQRAGQVVVLVLDGLGWLQLRERVSLAPALAAMEGAAITSVAPTTTSTALTSIVTGTPPGTHGVVGYRVHVGEGEILNVLRWTAGSEEAIQRVQPETFSSVPAFGGSRVPVVTRAEFRQSGFTRVLLGDGEIVGYSAASSIAVDVRRLLRGGAELVYAYYDGIDKVAHAHGLDDHYDAELATADRVVADVAATLPQGAALVVTADHGQVEVGSRTIDLPERVLHRTRLSSGEGRFRWLHVQDGDAGDVVEMLAPLEQQGTAWVRARDVAIADGWFGPEVTPLARSRMGDVVVAARAPVAFNDPAEGPVNLVCRHGSLTADEMLVPLLASAG